MELLNYGLSSFSSGDDVMQSRMMRRLKIDLENAVVYREKLNSGFQLFHHYPELVCKDIEHANASHSVQLSQHNEFDIMQ